MFSSCNRIRIVWDSAFIELVEGKEVAGELARRGAEALLYGPEYFCGIGKRGGFTLVIFRKEEQLRKLCWVKLPEMQQ